MRIELLIRRMDGLLKPLGFVRKRAVWNRRSGPFIDVIDVQISESNDMFTINAGVFDPEVYRRCWPDEPQGMIVEPKCTVRARIGQLVAGHDLWWDLDDLGSQRTLEQIAEAVSSSVLPFIKRMHSREAMETHLITTGAAKDRYPPPVLYLVALKYERGDGQGACALLNELRQRMSSDGWKARVGEIAERLGCS